MNGKLDGTRHQRKVSFDPSGSGRATPTRICILGGGFGGLYTALYLRRFSLLKSNKCEITLVEQKDRFLFTPLLYELVTDELQAWEIAPSYQKLLRNTNIRFCQDTIQEVDLKTRQVKLEYGEVLAYDYLVLAVGGETRLEGVPGAGTYAQTFRSLADVELLKQQLREFELSEQEQIRIAIAGAGPNGVELACKIADRLQERGQVLLIDRGNQILKTFSSHTQAAARRALSARGVRVELETSINRIEPDQITLVRDGQIDTLPVDLVFWTAGTRQIDWVRELDCQHNRQGQLISCPTLQLVDYPEVFALGDLAEIYNPRGARVPATAQAAFQQADCAARNLWAAIAGRRLRRFRYLHLGEMVTLGKGAAAVSSFGLNLEGRLASITRQVVYLQRLPTVPHRLQVVRNWVYQAIRQVVLTVWKWLAAIRRQLVKLGFKSLGKRRLAANYSRRSKY
jgi:NADH dehydrogenase